MKVLITGSNGFIAKNLIVTLKKMQNIEILCFSKKNSLFDLEQLISDADFIFHLAGVNRPDDTKEFYEGNSDLTQVIINIIEKTKKHIPILLSSSIQVGAENDYAKSKFLSEQLIENYSKNNSVSCFIYRLQNVFGKWCKPNYNSVIATWCHNIANDIEIQVNDRNTKLELVYIGDVIHAFIEHLYRRETREIYYTVNKTYHKTLGEIEKILYEFKKSRETLLIPNIGKGFERVLYATYLSYLAEDNFSYELKGHEDARGAFYEILKTIDSGQLSISTSAPGVTRGNHFHNTKNEKFLVIKGQARIQLRNLYSDKIIEYNVSEKKMEVVEMIPGYTHNISNTGDTEMVLLLWANEIYDEKKPDTNYLEV
ncbi:MAG: NAD-dependent epimerase/dehydratase family protein [Gammaproteobacteria bacterium]|nr:NAD-dependent epimerase/dehydratase family protein [Gammaproteobacteria bacterium]